MTDWSRSYPLDAFTELPVDPGAPAGPTLAVPANIPAHVDLDYLSNNLLPYTRQLIEVGDDPAAPRGSVDATYRSRSEAVYRVACDLAEAGCTPETVTSILLDSAYGISESV